MEIQSYQALPKREPDLKYVEKAIWSDDMTKETRVYVGKNNIKIYTGLVEVYKNKSYYYDRIKYVLDREKERASLVNILYINYDELVRRFPDLKVD